MQLENTITVAQLISLSRVFNRCPIYKTKEDAELGIQMSFIEWITNPDFVVMAFTHVVMVNWGGITLGIELDGYTHS